MGAIQLTESERSKVQEQFPNADLLEAYGQESYAIAVKRQKQIAGKNYRGVASIWGDCRQVYLVIRP